MISFRDMSFCLSSTSGQCENVGCHRYFSDRQKAAAEAWAISKWGKPGAPVAFQDYWDGCPDRIEDSTA